jgi:alpha-amylase
MGCDLDMEKPEVQEALKKWGKWYVDTTNVDGFRFDAVKHVRAGFFPDWLKSMCARKPESGYLRWVNTGLMRSRRCIISLNLTDGDVSLFDAPIALQLSSSPVCRAIAMICARFLTKAWSSNNQRWRSPWSKTMIRNHCKP